jgi:ABC-type polysaccharide transport system permease subunit
VGLAAGVVNFSYASAIGLFNSVIGFILLLIANRVSKKLTETSLF